MTRENNDYNLIETSANDRLYRSFIRKHGRTVLREVMNMLSMDYPIYIIAQEHNIDEKVIENLQKIQSSDNPVQRKMKTI